MALDSSAWTRDLLSRRRALHSAIDRLAGIRPADAARARLELYTVTHRYSTGAVDAAALDESLSGLEHSLVSEQQAA
jgi:hypothetical protein